MIGVNANGLYRISGGGKDDTAQLHSDGEAWQEDRSDHERVRGLV